MAATLKIKNSSTPTTAPSGLTAGEMAVNLADKKLYIGGTAGTNVIFLDSTSVVGTTAGSYLSIANNIIKLDLQTGATANLASNASKYDFMPILKIQNPTGVSAWNITGFSGPTQLISVPKLLNSAFPSLSQYTDGINNFADPILMGLSDGLTQAFNLFTIGVTTGSKASLFNLETDSGGGSLAIGVPTTITGDLTVNNTIVVNTINSVTNINSNAGSITIDASSGVTFTGNISARNIVNSFNGATGALQGVSAAVAGTGISVSGATGAVTITNTGVQTFNGLTGAVGGVTTSVANTFTALQTFSAGISASSGVTFASDIRVNSLTVGRGSGAISSNVAVGGNALVANTTGSNNIAVGFLTLTQNNIGSYNVGVGSSALSTNTTGESNVGVGSSALNQNSTGSNNVGVGTSALSTNPTGSNNTAIGFEAGSRRGSEDDGLDTGTGGIYIGYQARGSTNDQTNEIVIGSNALALGSNTAVIGATSQTAATIYGLLNLPSGLSAAGVTFTGNVTISGFTQGVEFKADSALITLGDINGGGNGSRLIIDDSASIVQIENANLLAGGATFSGNLKVSDDLEVNQHINMNWNGQGSATQLFTAKNSGGLKISHESGKRIKIGSGGVAGLDTYISVTEDAAGVNNTGEISFGWTRTDNPEADPVVYDSGNFVFPQSSGVTGNVLRVQSHDGYNNSILEWSAVIGATGATGATGEIPTDYVVSFNGLTGAVTGVTVGGANTFTQLNTFSAGISASGATFTGSISGATATFSKDITVNSITVGRGGGGIVNNVAVGEGALYSNTEGGFNVAVGEGALYSNTEGGFNVGVGDSALYSNTEGNYNVGVGRNALTSNTTGSFNIGVGENALNSNSTGIRNVGVGGNALFSNTTGSSNVGVGRNALYSNTTGESNVGVGRIALIYNTTGSNKTAIGYAAGAYRGTGSDENTTGTGGIYIGYQARGSTNGQTNEIVIGVDALGLGSNTAVIGATLQSAATIYGLLNLPSGLSTTGATFTGLISGATATFSKDITVNSITVGVGGGDISDNVAVGFAAFGSNTNGNRNVAVGESALATNTEGSNNVGVGRSALASNTEGSYNVGVGRNALNANTTGSGNVGVGAYALGEENTSGSDNVAVGSSALGNNTTGSNKTALGNNAGQYRGTGTDTNTTGTGGIYIGYQARGSTNAQTNEIVIGVDALGLGSNTAVIGATSQTAATIYGLLNLPSGLSASGATFTGLISGATATFSKDITVNSITVGRGGGDVNTNVAIGFECLGTNTTGTDSVGVGYRALRQNTTGIRNVGVGQQALGNNTDGSYKTAIGYAAGHYAGTSTTSLTTGTGGIYIGYQSRGSALAQTNEIVIGVDALGLGSNTAVIGATTQSAATIYGVLNLPSGLSAAGATLSGTVITSEKVNAITSARTVTVNFQNGNIQTLTGLGSGATGSSAIGFTGASATGSSTVTMIITNGGLMTSNTTFWSTAVKWPGGFKTTLSTSGVDILTFTTIDAGTNIYGMLGGKAFS